MRALKIVGLVLLTMVGAMVAVAASKSGPYPAAKQGPALLGDLPALQPSTPRRDARRTVVVLVYDGLASSLVAAVDTPNLDRLAREGASTDALIPVFPTLSMPNHWSLTTGCLPQRHGIVSNHFIDPERGLFNNMGDADWLLDCEPLHVVAERQGVRSAVFAWVGSGSTRSGALATVAEHYAQPEPGPQAQADKVVAQLKRPAAERPQLIAAYAIEPDHTVHYEGMDAEATRAQVAAVDAAVGTVMKAIEAAGLRDDVTLLVTTDHGMVAADKHLNIESFLVRENIDGVIASDGSIAHVYLERTADRDRARQALSKYAQYFEVFDTRDQPAYMHLGQGPRMGELLISMKPPYFAFDRGFWPAHLRWAAVYSPNDLLRDERFKAMHGYRPDVPGMASLLYAWGDGVARGVKLDGMRAIDLHPTVTRLLGIEPGEPVDGAAFEELFAAAPAPTDAGVAPPDAATDRAGSDAVAAPADGPSPGR